MFIHERNILPNVYAYVSYSETNTESILVQNNQQKMRFLFFFLFFADILEFPADFTYFKAAVEISEQNESLPRLHIQLSSYHLCFCSV